LQQQHSGEAEENETNRKAIGVSEECNKTNGTFTFLFFGTTACEE